MTREIAVLLLAAIAVVLLGLVAWGWWRRTRRDAVPLIAPRDDVPGTPIHDPIDALYLATTAHGAPLERLAAPGLAYRARATVTVTTDAVALDLVGQPRLCLTAERIVGVAQATVTIDRVVERDGMVCLSWRADTDEIVDTYLRPRNASARQLADALAPLAAAPAVTTGETP